MGNQNSIPKEKIEYKKFTEFDPKEIDEWSQNFYNVFPNETFNKNDLIRELKVYFPNGVVEPFSEHLFRALTKNKTIGFHEFLEIYPILMHGDSEKKLKIVFRLYDSNDDGHLCKEDVKKVSNALLLMLRDYYSPNFEMSQIIDDFFNEINSENVSLETFMKLSENDLQSFEILFGIF